MDRIVAATHFKDYILIFTERGVVYRAMKDDLTGDIKIELAARINLED